MLDNGLQRVRLVCGSCGTIDGAASFKAAADAGWDAARVGYNASDCGPVMPVMLVA